MEIGYSVPTILNEIVKQSQSIASEARWMEHYAHCQQNANQVADIENCVYEIEQHIYVIKVFLENLKSEDM